MRVTNLIKVFIVVFAVLAGANLYFSMLVARSNDEMAHVYEMRSFYASAVHDLRLASASLTRVTRAFVSGGANVQLYEFERYQPHVTDGGLVWQTFVYHGAPEDELYLLGRALAYQAQLREIDLQAIAAWQIYEDRELALEISFQDDYIVVGYAFIDVAQELENAMLVRTQVLMDDAVVRGRVFGLISQVSAVLFAATSVGGAFFILRSVKAAMNEEERRIIAEEENRAKTRFLARMSHEIRTPMSAVMGITEIQLRNRQHPPETEEAFLRIYSSSNLLLTIINDILDLSKIEADKMEITPAEYEVTSMIVDTVQLNMMHIGSRRLEFKLEVDQRLPLNMVGDEHRIKQVLNNLLSNAFKYTEEGHVILSFGVETHDGSDEIMLVIHVQDTGRGMTGEELSKLFEIEFTRFNIQGNRIIEGSGLGLMISHHLVTLMGGGMSVESSAGKGSTFTVRIPQKQSGESVLGKDTAENLQNLEATQNLLKGVAKFEPEPMPYGRVLVVDDVESNLYVARSILMPYKIMAETVTNGREAVKRIESGEVYDIIFMDHMMPDMDGIEATKQIRDMGYKHPIVALTANVVKGVSDVFLANGFDGFISKPIDLSQFDACLVQYIKDKQQDRALIVGVNRASPVEGVNNGSDSLSGGLVESFLLDVKKAKGIIQPLIPVLAQGDELDDKTLTSFVIQVHAMKSALMNVHESELSKVAYDLEQAGRAGDIATIRAKAPPFMDSLQSIVEKLSPEVIEHDNVSEDSAFLRDGFKAISAACREIDLTTAEVLLGAMRQKPCSGETKEIIKEISVSLLYGDYDKAAAHANQAAERFETV